MSDCPGVHCPGCKDGGGGGWLVYLGAVVVLAFIIRRFWHDIVEVVQIAALTVLGLVGASLATVIVVAAVRAYRAQPRRVSYRQLRQHRTARYTIKRLGTGATPQHRELMDRMNDDLAHQAAHLTDEPISASR